MESSKIDPLDNTIRMIVCPKNRCRANSVASCSPFIALTAAASLIGSPLSAQEEEVALEMPSLDELVTDDYAREELGVNAFTAPSISRLLKDIESLRPIPYDKIRRTIPKKASTDRTEIALTLGALIAQGFALVDAEKLDDLEDLARSLLRHAKGLSIFEEILPRASSLSETGLAGDWEALRKELTAAQVDAEKALLALRDEEMAHLISTGGWLRGLEIVAESILVEYTPERAAFLHKPELLDYFTERLETLNPEAMESPVVRAALAAIPEIRSVMQKPEDQPITREEVILVRDKSRKVIDILLGSRKAE